MRKNIDGTSSGRLVLVTGASGKIGKYVIKELLDRGFRVRAITSKPRDYLIETNAVEWRIKDFAASIDFDKDLVGCDAVVHLAAEIAETARMQRVNVEATRALARASERAQITVFCYTSSVSVYGNSTSRVITEESQTLTADKDVKGEYAAPEFLRTYGRTKLLGEIALCEEARSINYIILRPTIVVDIEDILKLGDLSYARKSLIARRHAHYVYILDVAHIIGCFISKNLNWDRKRSSISIYNVSEDEFPECSFQAIFRKIRISTGIRKFDALPAPVIADRLMSFARFGVSSHRIPFGQALFAADKLKSEGFRLRFGLEQFYSKAISHILREDG